MYKHFSRRAVDPELYAHIRSFHLHVLNTIYFVKTLHSGLGSSRLTGFGFEPFYESFLLPDIIFLILISFLLNRNAHFFFFFIKRIIAVVEMQILLIQLY